MLVQLVLSLIFLVLSNELFSAELLRPQIADVPFVEPQIKSSVSLNKSRSFLISKEDTSTLLTFSDGEKVLASLELPTGFEVHSPFWVNDELLFFLRQRTVNGSKAAAIGRAGIYDGKNEIRLYEFEVSMNGNKGSIFDILSVQEGNIVVVVRFRMKDSGKYYFMKGHVKIADLKSVQIPLEVNGNHLPHRPLDQEPLQRVR